ncbi:TonB-dependent receptor [bacterium]|nr:TonB-dependent receptor [bacterium]
MSVHSMIKRPCFYSVMFLLGAVAATFAQDSGVIKGQIIDRATEKPLSNVNITISGTGAGAATDIEGRFKIENLEPGKYDLVISYIGYQSKTIRNVILKREGDTPLLVMLEPSSLKGSTVVVTATRRPTLLENSPELTMVIPQTELTITAPQMISEALDYLPGVNTEGGTGSGQPFKRNISIDGLPSQYCMVLMNGARVVSSHYHTGSNVNVVPPEIIDRIELVKGAASAQYGSDGMGGVINIITKRGSTSPKMLFTSYGGSQNSFHTSLSVSGPVGDRIRHSIFSSWEQSDGTPIIEPVFREGQLDYSLFHLLDRVDAELGTKLSLGAQMFYLSSSYPYKGDDPYHSWLITPLLDLGYRINTNFTLNASGYYAGWQSERNAEINEIAEPEISLGFNGLKNNYLLVGGEFIYNNFRRLAVMENDRRAFGVFFQDEWQPISKLSLLAAVRMDKVADIEAVFTPKLTMMFEPAYSVKLRVSLGRGFRAPSLQDLNETLYGHGTHVRAGNPDLKPEYSTGLTGGIELNPSANLSLMANGYYTALTDMITPIDHGLENPYDYFSPEEMPHWDTEDSLVYIYRRENVHKASIYGGELKLLWNFFRNFYLEGAFNYTHNKNEDTGESLPYYPGMSFSGKLYGDQSINPWLRLGGFVGINAVSGRKIWKFVENGEQKIELDDYQKLEAGLNITIKERYQLFCNATNLLKQEIHSYEDVEMVLEGIPQFYAGLKINVF